MSTLSDLPTAKKLKAKMHEDVKAFDQENIHDIHVSNNDAMQRNVRSPYGPGQDNKYPDLAPEMAIAQEKSKAFQEEFEESLRQTTKGALQDSKALDLKETSSKEPLLDMPGSPIEKAPPGQKIQELIESYSSLPNLSLLHHVELPAILIFSLVFTWGIAYFGFSLFWLIVYIFVFYLIYQRRCKKYSKLVMVKITRDMAREKLETHIESTEWLNHMIAKFWGVYEPVLSAEIIDNANDTLEAACPAFLNSIKLTTFTLGSEPPAILGAKVYPDTDYDIIHLDLSLCFIPRQANDDVFYPLRRGSTDSSGGGGHTWSSKIILAARFGAAMVGVDIPILLQDITVEAKARIQIKLMSVKPVIKILQFSLLVPPKIDFVLKPLKTLDIMDGLINTAVSLHLVNPNMITINVDDIVNKAKASTEKSIGVLRVSVYGAKIPKTSDYMGVADPYTSIEISGRRVARTKTLMDAQEPKWNESFYVLLQDLSNNLALNIYHYNQLKKDKLIGAVELPLKSLLEQPAMPKKTQGLKSKETSSLKGELSYGLSYFPTLDPSTLIDAIDYKSGILRFTLHQAKEVVPRGGNPSKPLHLFAELYVLNKTQTDELLNPALPEVKSGGVTGAFKPFLPQNFIPNIAGKISTEIHSHIGDGHDKDSEGSGQAFFKTKLKKRTNSPIWEATFESFIKNSAEESLWVVIKEERDILGVTPTSTVTVGDVVISIDEINGHADAIAGASKESNTQLKKDWFNLRNVDSGRVRLSFDWMPVGPAMAEDDALQNVFVPAIGALNVTVIEAKNLGGGKTGQESLGKVYFKVSLGGAPIFITKAIEDSHPVWLHSSYAPIRALEDLVVFELYEVVAMRQDKFIGSAEVSLHEVAAKSKEGGEDEAGPQYWLPIKRGSSATAFGDLHVGLNYHPMVDKESPVHETVSAGDYNCGVLTLSILEGRALRPLSSASGKTSYVCEASVAKGTLAGTRAHYSTGKSDKGSLDNPKWSIAEAVLMEWMVLDQYPEATLDVAALKEGKHPLGIISLPLSECARLGTAEEWWPLRPVNAHPALGPDAALHMRFDYRRLALTLSPSDLVGETGTLHLQLVRATALMAADSSGTSDPFVVIKCDGIKVFKSKVIKKTTHPEWQEAFCIPIRNRKRSVVILEVEDWNRIDKAVPLGFASFPVSAFPVVKEGALLEEPGKEMTLSLENAPSGSITITGIFQSETAIMNVDAQGSGALTAVGHVIGGSTAAVMGGMSSVKHGVTGLASSSLNIMRRPFGGPAAVAPIPEESVSGAPGTEDAAASALQCLLESLIHAKALLPLGHASHSIEVYLKVRQGARQIYKSPANMKILSTQALDVLSLHSVPLDLQSPTSPLDATNLVSFTFKAHYTLKGDEVLLKYFFLLSDLHAEIGSSEPGVAQDIYLAPSESDSTSRLEASAAMSAAVSASKPNTKRASFVLPVASTWATIKSKVLTTAPDPHDALPYLHLKLHLL